MPTILTERLALRDFLPDDWESLNAFLSDAEVTRYMHFSSWSELDRQQWFRRCLENDRRSHRESYNWGIALRDTNRLIGWLGIGASSRFPNERSCGYALDRRFWGQGYMTEALRAVLRYEFEELGSQRISAECEVENLASARVMEKAGMTYEDTAYNADFQGNWAHRHRYAITWQQYERSRDGPATSSEP